MWSVHFESYIILTMIYVLVPERASFHTPSLFLFFCLKESKDNKTKQQKSVGSQASVLPSACMQESRFSLDGSKVRWSRLRGSAEEGAHVIIAVKWAEGGGASRMSHGETGRGKDVYLAVCVCVYMRQKDAGIELVYSAL